MWYLVKCFLKVQIDKTYCFIVARVIRVYHLGYSKQACHAATFISEAMLRVTDQVVYLYPEWPHRPGGCLACCGCTFDSAEVHWFILCTRRWGGTAREGGGCDQSIGSIVSDAIVHSWLWLTATRSSPMGCFSALLKVVDNRPHFLW